MTGIPSDGGQPLPADIVTMAGFSIDPATGEVLGGSAGSGDDQITELTRVCAEAQRVMKDQEAIYNAARAALERLLTESGRQSVTTAYGTPSLRRQIRRQGRPERVSDAVRRFELSQAQENLIWTCATALDAKQLDALAEAGALPADAIAEIVEAKTVAFLQVVPVRPPR